MGSKKDPAVVVSSVGGLLDSGVELAHHHDAEEIGRESQITHRASHGTEQICLLTGVRDTADDTDIVHSLSDGTVLKLCGHIVSKDTVFVT